MKQLREIEKLAAQIKALVLDVDGVMTDGQILIYDNGCEGKSFHVRDGHGLRLLKRAGIKTAILTGRYSETVTRRAAELEIELVIQRCHDKLSGFFDIAARLDLPPEEMAYMGDDVVDLPPMSQAGLAATVKDAVPEVKEASDWISRYKGGRGAVRELCEFILKAKKQWHELTQRYK